MAIRIHDTLTREKREFVPQDPERVTMYVCGPTVYNFAHIGNARPVVVFDLLYRLLSLRYPEVVYARNITDVDDKIMKAAAEQGVPIAEVTEHYARVYQEDMRSLGALDPTLQPKVTDNLDAILAMIGRLIEGGYAYAAEGHVLFDVTSYAEYGALSRRKRDEMIAGARVEVAPYKRDPGDFVLWKPSSDEQPGWDSPWGRGRPGWHIECSAMSEAHLGETIDIHAGGQDLIFPHHENEIAQSVCSHGGRTYARYWMHNGFLTVDQSKMSKSLGNFVTVHELLEHHPGEALRLALMAGHYRAPLDWNEEGIQQARSSLDRLYRALRDLGDVAADPAADEPEPALVAALEDDLNTPQALATLFPLAKAANASEDPAERARLKARLLASGRLLGILQQDPADWFSAAGAGDLPAEEIDALVAARNAARAAKDWAEADRIRDELAAAGITIEDGPGGTLWSRG